MAVRAKRAIREDSFAESGEKCGMVIYSYVKVVCGAAKISTAADSWLRNRHGNASWLGIATHTVAERLTTFASLPCVAFQAVGRGRRVVPAGAAINIHAI